MATIPRTAVGRRIRYGRELIAHTAQYLEPAGSVAHLTTGMNCQNCHLQAGPQSCARPHAAWHGRNRPGGHFPGRTSYPKALPGRVPARLHRPGFFQKR